MNSRTILFSCVIAVISALFFPQFAHAASTLTVSPSGDGNYVLQGNGLENAAALEITLQYDSTSLSNPRVVEGGLIAGALMAVNPNVPGTVRMAIIRTTPITGSGAIAALSFDRKGSSGGNILSMNVRLADINGSPITALVQIVNSPDATAAASTSPQDQGTSHPTSSQISAGGGSTPAVLPSVIIATGPREGPGDQKTLPDAASGKEESVQPDAPESVKEQSKHIESIDIARIGNDLPSATKAVGGTIYTQKSVLDLFREFKGDRTRDKFISFFERGSLIGFRQDPAVALSDGKMKVRVTFVSTPGNRTTADVAVMGARLLSMRKDLDNTNTWTVELIPEKGTLEASLAVSQDGMKMVFPLTVAPKSEIDLKKSGASSEADFNQVLNERGTGNAPRIDLNRDGKSDYLDDYILTANYLALKGE